MKLLKSLHLLVFMSAAFLLVGTAANAAPLSIVISSPFQTAGPDTTLSFDATVTNTDITDTVYLNSDDLTLGSLAVDDSPFFNNFPFFLTPGESFTGEIFTVSIGNGGPFGLIPGSFEIVGGDASDFTDVAGSADFDVYVTPEPSSLLLLATGLVGLAAISHRRVIG